MDDPKLLIYAALGLAALATARKALYDQKLAAIPVAGSSGFLASYRDALKFILHAPELIQQGYDQYPDGIFRVARLWHWDYIVCGPKLVNDVGGAPEDVLSFSGGVEELTMGRALAENPYHQHTIRTSLTRNLHRCFPDVRDEIVCAFDEVLQLQGSEWKALPVLPTTMAVVARVSNRLFVGLPLCRNKAYLQNNIQYTIDVIRSAGRITLWPGFLRPIVGPFISNKEKSNATALKILGPILEERLAKEKELGPDWPGKPNDFISWLLELAEGEERTAPALALRILSTNMAAIHTSSMAFTHALFDLTVHPEHLLPMREEVERVVKEEGWSKAALNNMVKVDSFLRESQRLNGNGPMTMTRKVVAKDGFRFSNGVVLPYGSFVSVASRPTHYDPSNYENAAVFDGFRFARERAEQKLQEDPTKDIFKRHMVSTGTDHLPFGTGKHACPGRFFAATELKAMLAHLVLNYDVKAEVEGVRPADNTFGPVLMPNSTAQVRIRKRQ
ncbi:cytochrome P450 [Mycena rosella]|uniref:Cytochrome P450 n=1 Tax=Mycena rosella TaxID=1033263 RepID=A0AAD7CRN9_MYCRO|nr:cytochrome P450 [Mycena rosella]